jgi:signal transduction histidine kinase/ActR/RegA family two-component response regulator
VIALAGAARHVLFLEGQLVESLAVKDADRFTAALREFRSLYTTEVVARAQTKGITITHNYESQPGALPLPATLSMLLGRRLTQSTGGDVRLYSDYPFPWATGNELDGFQQFALQELRKNPNKSIHRIEAVDGEQMVRFATADRMGADCVACHNTHPDSPKRDWVEGDVRGVLEVTRPLIPRNVLARLDLRDMIRRLVGIAILALSVLGVVVVFLRGVALRNIDMTRDAEAMTAQLQDEIAQRKRVEAQVIFAQKLESLGTLAGGIAHDFNNLLAGIQGHTELALLASTDPDTVSRHLRTIHKTGDQAKTLISQMLLYAGGNTSPRRPVDLTHRVNAIVPLLSTASRTGAQLVFETDSDLPMMIGDPAQLDQLIMNLVTNAADATGDRPGVIVIRTGLVDGHDFAESSVEMAEDDTPRIFLEIEDPGIGLSEEAQARMFEPFFSTKGAGRGLGLAAIQGIVRSHGGIILVASIENQGTSVRVEFPVDTAVHASDDTVVDTQPVEASDIRRVLVVDDDPQVRTTTVAILQSHGVETEGVASGEAAIARLKSDGEAIDGVVLDMAMPGMSGLETYMELTQLQASVQVVFVSGFVVDPTVQALVDSGDVSFLLKPFSMAELLNSFGLSNAGPDS